MLPLSTVLKTTKPYLTRLKELGIESIDELLNFFPRAYKDASVVTAICAVKDGEFMTVKGKIASIKSRAGFRSHISILSIVVQDASGTIESVWFNQKHLGSLYKKGDEVVVSGKVKYQPKKGTFLFNAPSIEHSGAQQIHAGRIIPVYPETELTPQREKSRRISSKWLREKIHKAIPFAPELADLVPVAVQRTHRLIDRPTAVVQVHFPDSAKNLELGKRRLAFEELFLLQLAALYRKAMWQRSGNAPVIEPSWDLIKEFTQSLPWQLTNAQKKAAYEIINDMAKSYPMCRLLEGDTGSGKTVVAAAALLHTIKKGYQVCLLAPTEILAQQHAKTIKRVLAPFGITPHILVGSLKTSEKKKIAATMKSGEAMCVIGTHAIIQEGVLFNKLGLAVIDEQHRFGVKQREILKEQGSPHILHMTATPIPRTLALVLYGDQELSVLDEMPAGRQTIVTRIVPENKRNDAYKWIHGEIKSGRQAFIVFPLIHESEQFETKAATVEFLRLKEEIFPDLKLGLLHGQMKAEEKEVVMHKFSRGELNILVSTAVIEVGVDVPNATIMMIEGAERFGLAQLHQFRGRVGRGSEQSYCLLFPTEENFHVMQRLSALVKHTSGFDLAEIDLQLRGAGEVYGTAQSGLPDLKMATLTDIELIRTTREAARGLLEHDPELHNSPALRKKIVEMSESVIV